MTGLAGASAGQARSGMPSVSCTGAAAGDERAKFETVRPSRRTGLAGGAGVCSSQRASCDQLLGRVHRVGQRVLAAVHREVVRA